MKYRKHVRLKGYDYSKPGYYFVTVCTRGRRELFEPRVDPKWGHKIPETSGVAAPFYGARRELTQLVVEKLGQVNRYYLAEIDFYVIMPDHIHMIIILEGGVALAMVIKAFKSWVTMAMKEWAAQSAAATKLVEPEESIWQPNYYEHIIRSESS